MFKRLLGKESIVQDSSIYSNQDYSDLILDSASIEHYIAKDTALEVFQKIFFPSTAEEIFNRHGLQTKRCRIVRMLSLAH
jgi:hypothetical protein